MANKDATTIVREHGEMETELATIRPLVGDKTKLVAGAVLPTNLVTAGNAIFNLTIEAGAAKTTANALAGDKNKLAAGATVPSDLVSAANTIFDLNAKLAKAEAEKTSVAAEVARLGITSQPGGTAAKTTATPAAATPAWNPDAAILAARGVKDLAELNSKYKEGVKVG